MLVMVIPCKFDINPIHDRTINTIVYQHAQWTYLGQVLDFYLCFWW
jgi:hypothetical protein